MKENTFDEHLKQIRAREQSTLAVLEEVRQTADTDLLPSLEKIRSSSLKILTDLDEIADRQRRKKSGPSRA
jgi:hypothetical protein